MSDAQQAIWIAAYAAALEATLNTLRGPNWPSDSQLKGASATARAAADMAVQHLTGALDTFEKRGGF